MQEVARILGKRAGVFQRTLNTLAEEGLLKSEYRANARYFQANTKSPFYPEFKSLVAKSAGVAESLKGMVSRLRGVKTAAIYGSFAKDSGRPDSDIDLLIVGKPQLERKLLKEILLLEKGIQREINYKIYSETEYRKKRAGRDPFLEEVLSGKMIVLKGNFNAV
jgi:predicted nucleotidyltransferase